MGKSKGVDSTQARYAQRARVGDVIRVVTGAVTVPAAVERFGGIGRVIEIGQTEKKGRSRKAGERVATKVKTQAADEPSPSLQVSPSPGEVCLTLGAVAWLMTQSPVHRHLFLADLEWLILPPLMLGQTRLYHDKEKPLAFVAWAFLDEETEARITAGVPRLQPKDWNSGDRPWIIETIAPAGGVLPIIDDLTASVFGGVRPRVVGEKG